MLWYGWLAVGIAAGMGYYRMAEFAAWLVAWRTRRLKNRFEDGFRDAREAQRAAESQSKRLSELLVATQEEMRQAQFEKHRYERMIQEGGK